MTQHILTLNAGSSSIKFALFEVADMSMPLSGMIEGLGTHPRLTVSDGAGKAIEKRDLSPAEASQHRDGLATILAFLAARFAHIDVIAVGHRVVHGGMVFTRAVRVDAGVFAALEALQPLDPLHQPHNLAGITAASAAFPGTPQIACFDTAFHRTQSFVNETYAIPRHFYDEGVRRFGFHGLSYEYVARRLRDIAPGLAAGRVIVAHLGNGASMCAMKNGRSVASTMGFSPLDGLPMGTRPGQIDPGVLLYLLNDRKMTGADLTELLWQQSGLKGLSGISSDMRDLEASGTAQAGEAIAYFAYRIQREIGSLAAALGGLDAIVFCGGIGENAWRLRQSVLEAMAWIGMDIDIPRNRDHETVISTAQSAVQAMVIRTNEELMIAEHAASFCKPVAA